MRHNIFDRFRMHCYINGVCVCVCKCDVAVTLTTKNGATKMKINGKNVKMIRVAWVGCTFDVFTHIILSLSMQSHIRKSTFRDVVSRCDHIECRTSNFYSLSLFLSSCIVHCARLKHTFMNGFIWFITYRSWYYEFIVAHFYNLALKAKRTFYVTLMCIYYNLLKYWNWLLI